MLGNLILVVSCLDRPPVDLTMLRDSIHSLMDTGHSCLIGGTGSDPALNLPVAEALRQHIEAEVPRTQICCRSPAGMATSMIRRKISGGRSATMADAAVRLEKISTGQAPSARNTAPVTTPRIPRKAARTMNWPGPRAQLGRRMKVSA